MSTIVYELQWIMYIQELQVPISLPISLKCDNQASLHIASNTVFHKHSKPLEIDCQVVRNKLIEGFIFTEHIGSKVQLADLLTKPLGNLSFVHLLSKMGLVKSSPFPS